MFKNLYGQRLFNCLKLYNKKFSTSNTSLIKLENNLKNRRKRKIEHNQSIKIDEEKSNEVKKLLDENSKLQKDFSNLETDFTNHSFSPISKNLIDLAINKKLSSISKQTKTTISSDQSSNENEELEKKKLELKQLAFKEIIEEGRSFKNPNSTSTEKDFICHNDYKPSLEDENKILKFRVKNFFKEYKNKEHIKDIYKRDFVKVVHGEFKGQSGRVIGINYAQNKIKIKGVNPELIIPDINNSKSLKKIKVDKNGIGIKKFKYNSINLKDCMLISPYTNALIKPRIDLAKSKTYYTRYCSVTGFPIPFPETKLKNFEVKKKDNKVISIVKIKNFQKSNGTNITPKEDVLIKTYKGLDYCQIAQDFLNIKKERQLKADKLILKDKVGVFI